MDNKEFKKIFNDIAATNGFKSAYGGWFKESTECIAVLELQKSNFGNYYILNVKVFIQGLFERLYPMSKDLVKSSLGHVNSNGPPEYKDILDMDHAIDVDKRREKLSSLFEKHIVPFTNKVLSKSGIKELEEHGQIYLLPAIKEQIG